MLARDVRFEGFDAADFMALGELFGRRAKGSSEPSGGVVVLVDRGRVAKVFSTLHGRLPPSPAASMVPLKALCGEHRAAWAIRVERHGLSEVADRFARRLARGDAFLTQTLKLLAVLRELAEEGAIETYPRDVRALSLPREATIWSGIDMICPVGRTLLVGAFDGGDVFTSLALHRGPGGFDRIVGPSEVRREMGLVSSDWTRNVAGLARAVELSVGPLSLGCFAQARTFRSLSETDAAGAWALAVASRAITFHPVAPALAIPLGLDVGRAAFAVARDLAVRFGGVLSPTGPFGPALERVKDAGAFGQSELSRLLGWDPVSFFRDLLGRSRFDA